MYAHRHTNRSADVLFHGVRWLRAQSPWGVLQLQLVVLTLVLWAQLVWLKTSDRVVLQTLWVLFWVVLSADR